MDLTILDGVTGADGGQGVVPYLPLDAVRSAAPTSTRTTQTNQGGN